MNTITFHGYTAGIGYDERDSIFADRVLGLLSIISVHGKTVSELRREFEVANTDYLADCQKQGIAPEKPASGKLLLRVPPEVHSRALVRAQAMGKSLTQRATGTLQQAMQTDSDRVSLPFLTSRTISQKPMAPNQNRLPIVTVP